jgi:hypothetical protein
MCVIGMLCATALAAGCVEPMQVHKLGLDKERFTRVNLRPEGKTLRSSNFLILDSSIQAGAPARVTFYSAEQVRLLVHGLEYVMWPVPQGSKFPTDDAGIDNFLDKLFVDRKEALAAGPESSPEMKAAVANGRWVRQMTKDEIYACLGPPMEINGGVPAISLPRSAILQSDYWTYPHQLILFETTRANFIFLEGKLQDVKQQ